MYSNKNLVRFFTVGLPGIVLLVAAVCILFAPTAAANTFPSDAVTPHGDADDHLAISSIQGNWYPPNDPAPGGQFLPGGAYNCRVTRPGPLPGSQDAGACATGLAAAETYYQLYMPRPAGATPSTTLRIEGGCRVDSNTGFNKPSQPDKGNRQIKVNIYRITAGGGRDGGSVSSADNYSGGSPTTCDNGDLLVNVPGSAFTTNQANRYGNSTLTALVGVFKNTTSDADGGGSGNKTFRLKTDGVVTVYGSPGNQFAEVSKYPADGAEATVNGRTKNPTIYEFSFVPDCDFGGGDLVLGLGALSIEDPVLQPYDVRVSFTGPGIPYHEVTRTGGGWPLGNLQRNATYRLFILDIGSTNGIKFNLPYGEYAPIDCQPAQCTVDCSAIECLQYTHTLRAHSIYRFAIFPRNQNYLTGNPPSPRNGAPGGGDWASYAPGMVHRSGAINSNDTSEYRTIFPEPSGPDWLVYIERWEHYDSNGNGTLDKWRYFQGTDLAANCYSASCTLNFSPNVPGTPNGVVGNSQFSVSATITNTGRMPLPESVGGRHLVLTGNGDFPINVPKPTPLANVGFRIDKGITYPWSFSQTAPGGIGNYNLSAYPDYYGRFALGPSCGTPAGVPPVAVYQPFALEPHAELIYQSDENPNPITYGAYVTNNASVAVPAPTTSVFYHTPYGSARNNRAGPVTTSGPYNPGGRNYTLGLANYPPPSINAGDEYCSEITFSGTYNQGYVGPGGAIAPGGFDESKRGDKACVTVKNKPYFKVYNSGVSAGGNFSSGGGSCTGGGLLAGWNDNTGQNRGAGTQLSALALIKITGFASAQAAPTNLPTKLTFANTIPGDITGSLESPGLGGNFDPTGNHCLTDATPSTKAGAEVETHTGNHTLPATNVSAGHNRSVFVDGDVRITGNVTYAGPYTMDNVPSFVLHATGNIYIDPGVTELNGLYIAKGKIYTCGNGTGYARMSDANIYGSCNSQLTIYGSFVASQINLMRAYGSLRNAVTGEQGTSAPRSCSRNGAIISQPICAAEVFSFSPEFYLADQAIQLPSNGAVQYDAITSLPPVL